MNIYKDHSPKIFKNAKEALFDLTTGCSLMSGGFGLCGIPENCIDEICHLPINNLTVISNNIGNAGQGLAKILVQGKISEAYCSYVGGNPDLESRILSKEIHVHLIPQGSFVEKIRAAGAGIRAFYVPAGVGTIYSDNKEIRDFDRPCILEEALYADFAIIKAEKGDPFGNLWFKETARNFSPLMAMAAKVTIVEVEELVPLGALPPENIHLPGIFVQRIFHGKNYRNAIEFIKTQEEENL